MRIDCFFVYCDHGFRSLKEREKDRDCIQTLLDPFNLKLINKNLIFDVEFSESEARDLRLSALSQVCIEKNARGIILGHHKDDSVETVLMQLCRGAKSGFKGIRPKISGVICQFIGLYCV